MIPDDFHKMVDDIFQTNSILEGCTSNATDKECFYRTAVDRAYYAAFLKSREWLVANEGFRPTKKGLDHKLVAQQIKQSRRLQSNRLTMSSKLYGLRECRNNASYDLDGFICTKKHAKNAIINSQEVLQELY
ncbi:MAG: hypothetical protein K8E24_005105 [Methanobacterium paludis]|nr:hypothetical protein [Methanobacterium paludis]